MRPSVLLWWIAAGILAVAAVPCAFWGPARFGLYAFGGLALGAGVVAFAMQHAERHRFWRVLARLGQVAFALFLVSFALIEGIILAGESADPEAEQADYVLVLGGGLIGNQPSLTLQARLDVAYDFLTAHPDARAILCGGQGPDEIIAEGDAMKNYLVNRGIAEDRLLTETHSTSTIENIANAYELYLAPLSSKPATAVITSEFHLARARQLMAAQGLDPYGLPAPTPYRSLSVVYHVREYCSVLGLMLTGRWDFSLTLS